MDQARVSNKLLLSAYLPIYTLFPTHIKSNFKSISFLQLLQLFLKKICYLRLQMGLRRGELIIFSNTFPPDGATCRCLVFTQFFGCGCSTPLFLDSNLLSWRPYTNLEPLWFGLQNNLGDILAFENVLLESSGDFKNHFKKLTKERIS